MPDSDTALPRRLHVVGCPRSGTTLMMELLWQCYVLGGRCEHEISLFDEPARSEDLYLTKKPSDTYRIEPLLRADDALYVVAMQRDPRAVLASVHPRRPDEYYCDFPRWLQHQQAIEALRDHPRFAVVAFEALVREPNVVQRDLTDRLAPLREATCRGHFGDYPNAAPNAAPTGVAAQSVAATAVAALGGVRPFDTARLSGFRDHGPRLRQQLAVHPSLQDWLQRLDYETDARWQDSLAATPAQTSRQQSERRPHLFKRLETRCRYALKARRYRRLRGIS